MAIEKPTWTYKSKGDKQTASEMNELAQAVITNAIELSNTKDDIANLNDDITNFDNRITSIEDSETVKKEERNQPNGYAGLDSSGKIPVERIYGVTAAVTDVAAYESLPAMGSNGVIYNVLNTGAQYKWSGSVYVDITDGADNAKKNETSIFDCSNGTSTKYYSSLSEAINVVPPVYRTSNRIISYLSTENSTTSSVNYQYHGIDSTTWTNLTKWERVPNQADLAEIRSDLNEIETIVEQVKERGLEDGSIELSKLSTTLAAYIGSGGEVTNQADDDDLENTIINGVPVIREKTTKTYSPETHSGMGRVILRKNIVNGVNVLTQEMINQANTIYEIRYGFTLNENITIPANCVLKFDGGSVRGEHTITGQNTGIDAGLIKIFNTDVTLAGTWNIVEAYPEWFGANSKDYNDCTVAFIKCIKFLNTWGGTIRLSQGAYYIKNLLIDRSGITIKGAGPTSSFLVGENIGDGEFMIKVKPSLEYMQSENGFFSLENVQIYAEGETSRTYGTGIDIHCCYAYLFKDVHFLGFKHDCKVRGSHYATFINCVFSDRKFAQPYLQGYPGIEIYNRGVGLEATNDYADSAGLPQGIKITGGWICNTSLNLEYAGQVHLSDLDLEPMSNSLVLGYNSIIENCRLERFTLYAVAGQYDKFPWVIIKGSNNVFKDNAFSDAGIQVTQDNPYIVIEGSQNVVQFNRNYDSHNIVKFGENATKNIIRFYEYLANGGVDYEQEDLLMYSTNVKSNIIEYYHNSAFIKNYKDRIELGGIKRVGLCGAFTPAYMSCTHNNGTITITNDNANKRIVFCYNSPEKYIEGVTYAVICKITIGDNPISLRLAGDYAHGRASLFNFPSGYDGYIVTRFKAIDNNSSIWPGLNFIGETGSTFEVNDFQIIQLDNVQEKENFNLKSTYRQIFNPIIEKGKTVWDDANNKQVVWNGTAWVDATGTPV